ncbi:hypothetical protein F2Q69_00040874 [Brassica cretica]|uniref:Uncharacterized protein n=1 Tax=Brassica cretica TaxID=69181 RepID=A0A8S9NSA8_BRACR|nr:hypothetical protein F2Q69_00040874 [Brassica cretica]
MLWCTSRGGEKHIWCGSFHVSNVVIEPEECCARSAHKAKRGRLKMQDVCPEVVADVVADADDMLSGEDHVESRC